jgi:hypothetical protein
LKYKAKAGDIRVNLGVKETRRKKTIQNNTTTPEKKKKKNKSNKTKQKQLKLRTSEERKIINK